MARRNTGMLRRIARSTATEVNRCALGHPGPTDSRSEGEINPGVLECHMQGYPNLTSHLYIYVRDTCKFSSDFDVPMVFIQVNPRPTDAVGLPLLIFPYAGLPMEYFL